MRGATMTAVGRRGTCRFQSTLLMRGATAKVGVRCKTGEFQSTLLMRGATRRRPGPAEALHHFNPRSSCEERRLFSHGRRRENHISIHAPHARSDDLLQRIGTLTLTHFNPRSSCEERRPLQMYCHYRHISIHAPHARSDEEMREREQQDFISIHAPHARSDRP